MGGKVHKGTVGTRRSRTIAPAADEIAAVISSSASERSNNVIELWIEDAVMTQEMAKEYVAAARRLVR
jgi:hypothetical protein